MKSASFLPGLVLGTLLTSFVSGCASTDSPSADTPRNERIEPVTGSNIPRKPQAPASSDKERAKTSEPTKDQAAGTPASPRS